MTHIVTPGYFEPSLSLEFLPGCPCGERHPLAMKPKPADPTKCPRCGAQAGAPGRRVDVPALITGKDPLALLGRAFLDFARFLSNLAKRL